MHKLEEWASDKKIAFMSPYGTPLGKQNAEIVNGITGVPYTFKNEEGADYYCYHDLKQMSEENVIEIFNKYDVWIYPVYAEYFQMLIDVRKSYKGIVIGVTDIQTHTLSYWPLNDLSLFIEALNCYDAIMATNMDEVETFRGCLKDPKKIDYTGWCMYPEKIHDKYYKPIEEREKNLISVGISNPGDFNRDLITNLTVYNKLKEKNPDIKGFMYYVTPNKIVGLKKIIQQMGCKDFMLVTELPYAEAMDFLSRAYLSIHMYTFKVVGRLAQDCAALGVPMVGTIANLPNRMCFPEISVLDYDVDACVHLANDMLNNEAMHEHISNKGRSTAKSFYGLESTRNRIFKLLQESGVV